MTAMRAMRAKRFTSTREKLIVEIHDTNGKLPKTRKRHEFARGVLTILEVKLFNLQQRYNELLSPTIAKLREELPQAHKRQHCRQREKRVKKAKKFAIQNATTS